MLESGSSGSVRGASSNGRPYREPRSVVDRHRRNRESSDPPVSLRPSRRDFHDRGKEDRLCCLSSTSHGCDKPPFSLPVLSALLTLAADFS